MALKDWKKGRIIVVGKYPSQSWNNKKDDGRVGISKYVDGYWHIHIRAYKGNISKSFKTKQQALKFAKAYMRKH